MIVLHCTLFYCHQLQTLAVDLELSASSMGNRGGVALLVVGCSVVQCSGCSSSSE